jgi:hypothetical protein
LSTSALLRKESNFRRLHEKERRSVPGLGGREWRILVVPLVWQSKTDPDGGRLVIYFPTYSSLEPHEKNEGRKQAKWKKPNSAWNFDLISLE